MAETNTRHTISDLLGNIRFAIRFDFNQ